MLRVGDAERDAAAADLGDHYAAGRLTLDELNERLDAVFTAMTFGQLVRVMADLPGPGRVPWLIRSGMPGDPGARHRPEPSGARRAGSLQDSPMSTDRAGRYAALALLVLAMLIWLFTALLFARHGIYHQSPYGPPGPFNHNVQPAQLLPVIHGMAPPAP
jgi:hypothetical protein